MLRRVAREGVLLFGGQRALLLQIAHPAIAAGVAEHSGFREHPFRRLFGTLDALLVITFGTAGEAARVLAHIDRIHARVRGQVDEPPASAGPYSAFDPDLQLWVLATLADTSELLFSRYVRALRDGEAEALWRDWRRFGERFGLPAARMPADHHAFRAYMAEMVSGPTLAASRSVAEIARSILRAPLALGRVTVNASLTAGLLPPSLRRAYGLPWGPLARARFALADRALGGLVPRAPRLARRAPEAYLALRRALA